MRILTFPPRLFLPVIFLSILLFASIFASLIYPDGPFSATADSFLPPSADHIFGTDALGRSVAVSMLYGAKISLISGFCATLGAMVIGTVGGVAAGLYIGWIDTLIVKVTEFFQTLPAFLMAIMLIAIFGTTLKSIILALTFVMWPPVLRLARAEARSISERPFVYADRGNGYTISRIIFITILPNIGAKLLVYGGLITANAILIEAALSFLGLGDPNYMTWGYLIGVGRELLRQAWWVSFFPGVAITFTVLVINLLSDSVSELF